MFTMVEFWVPSCLKKACRVAVERLLLIINCVLLAIGICGGPLIMRLYFVRGGKRIWFSSWLETAGWPVMLIPLLVNYTRRCHDTAATAPSKLFLMNRRVFLASAAIGTLTGLDNYLYAFGVAKLPVSTSSLLIATQLAFTAGFAFIIVRQRFTAYSTNAIILLTVGAVVLGMHTDGDRPAGESNRQYFLGFFLTLAAAALYGFILPVVELTYKKAKQAVTYTLVMEFQMVMCIFATAFCTVGMLANNDFQAIPRETKEYGQGEFKYYLVIGWSAIIWQCFFLGTNGVIFYSTSLLSAILITVLLPVTEILAVIFFNEKFQVEKGISLFLSLWGFISYFYGEAKDQKKKKKKTHDNTSNNLTSNEA